jgi:hypothetical protein
MDQQIFNLLSEVIPPIKKLSRVYSRESLLCRHLKESFFSIADFAG